MFAVHLQEINNQEHSPLKRGLVGNAIVLQETELTICPGTTKRQLAGRAVYAKI
jgi:hypothetical protein